MRYRSSWRPTRTLWPGGDWEEAAAHKVDLTHGYPSQDGFYFDESAPERRYLWRWICYQAPDLVVEIALSDNDNDAARWEANEAAVGSTTAENSGRRPHAQR